MLIVLLATATAPVCTGVGRIPADPCRAASLLPLEWWLHTACEASKLATSLKNATAPHLSQQELQKQTGSTAWPYGVPKDPFRNFTYPQHGQGGCTSINLYTSEAIRKIIVGEEAFPITAPPSLNAQCETNSIASFVSARDDIDSYKSIPAAELAAELKWQPE